MFILIFYLLFIIIIGYIIINAIFIETEYVNFIYQYDSRPVFRISRTVKNKKTNKGLINFKTMEIKTLNNECRRLNKSPSEVINYYVSQGTITREEAKKLYISFYDTYPHLKKHIDKVGDVFKELTKSAAKSKKVFDFATMYSPISTTKTGRLLNITILIKELKEASGLKRFLKVYYYQLLYKKYIKGERYL